MANLSVLGLRTKSWPMCILFLMLKCVTIEKKTPNSAWEKKLLLSNDICKTLIFRRITVWKKQTQKSFDAETTISIKSGFKRDPNAYPHILYKIKAAPCTWGSPSNCQVHTFQNILYALRKCTLFNIICVPRQVLCLSARFCMDGTQQN